MAAAKILSGQGALVTGASSGIGAAVAKLFAQHGAKVAATGRNEAALAALVAEIEGGGGLCKAFPADVTDDAAVTRVVSQTVQEFGALSILVNNAGVLRGGATDVATMTNWDFNFDVNARAPFCYLVESVPHLKVAAEAGGAAVVNVSSVNGQQSFGGCVAYCASKAALDMVTKCASVDLAPFGIRVNSVNPGVTMTNLQKAGGLTEAQYGAFVERSISTTHPLATFRGSCASPDEVAQAVLFLASDQSSFTTGSILCVDGGRLNLGAR